jgi:hypothetical protein
MPGERLQRMLSSQENYRVSLLQKIPEMGQRFQKSYEDELDTYSADAEPLPPPLKLSRYRTVFLSKGTVVPPD